MRVSTHLHQTAEDSLLTTALKVGVFLAAMAALAAGAAPAENARSGAGAIIARIDDRNPDLHSFEARVHVNVRMLSFPFFAPKLDGTSYYKRPDNYEVVFDRVPPYAHGFNKLFTNIGDAAGWERECNVAYKGVKLVDGRPFFVLSMTKKIRSDQLREAVAYVDPASYEVVRMEWNYFNGGTIVMTQSYRDEGAYRVIAAQHADIRIPHVHAIADAMYGRYDTNVAVSDSVFTKK